MPDCLCCGGTGKTVYSRISALDPQGTIDEEGPCYLCAYDQWYAWITAKLDIVEAELSTRH